MDDLVLTFGAHKGSHIDHVPDNYILWLADPARENATNRKNDNKPYKPLPANIVAAARKRAEVIRGRYEREQLAKQIFGGKPHENDHPLYIIECEGDMHSHSGDFAFDYTIHNSLDDALALIASEYPSEEEVDEDGVIEIIRTAPDAEDDRILIWEVLSSGHRKVVWGFFGWHFSADEFECGQGSLPGDDCDLYAIAMME